MRMRCVNYGRDWDDSFFVIFQTDDGRLCRVELDAWDGRYSGFPDGTVIVDIGFECDTNDYRYITKWFNNVQEYVAYCKMKGFKGY